MRKIHASMVTVALAAILMSVVLPFANAQARKATFPYIGAIPNPVQVNTEVLFHVGITDTLTTAADGWENLSIEIVRPDNKTEYITNIRTDSTGGTGRVYIPTLLGTYRARTIFPEQVYRGVTYLASVSDWVELTVQAEPIPTYPGIPTPSEYWTRPIDQQAREWYTIAGSWHYTPDNLYAPYNDGPETAHILWTKPFTLGGLVGGDIGLETSINQGPVGMETGDAYEGKWSSPLVLMGRVYYRAGAYDRPRLWYCVDLHTGETLWAKTFLDNQSIAFGQLFYWQSYNYMGTFAYLWVTVGTTWTAFDAFTGEWRAAITNVPSGTTLRDNNDNLYRLTVSLTGGRMALWNLSALISMAGSFGSAFSLRQYNASSGTYRSLLTNGTLGAETTSGAEARVNRSWSWNVTIPTGLPGSTLKMFYGDRVIGGLANTTHVILWGLSLKPGEEGKLLFTNTWNAPAFWYQGNVTVSGFGGGWIAWSKEDKVGVLYVKETRENYAFSLETGAYLWKTEPEHYLNAIEDTKSGARGFAYGKLYCASVDGIVYCYDAKTGQRLWTYEAYDPYNEQLWSNNWWMRLLFITDGKVYVGHYEHSANQPLPRGAPFICLNAETGEEIFRVNGMFRQSRWGGRAIIGDSIIVTQDTYDQRVYAIGRGPSATTVSVLPKVVQNGQPVVIEGYVTDVSPGTKDSGIAMRFPNGVPAVADESMSDWMLYVYKQFPRPSDVKGVWVTFDAVSPEGKWMHIGGTHTDSNGMYSIPWTPPTEGLWTIVITFPGSKSYYASYAETSIFVTAAPPPPETPEIPTPPDYTPILTGLAIAVIIAIVIGLVNLYALRKRK